MIVSLRNYIIKKINYNWQVMSPQVQLIRLRGPDKQLTSNKLIPEAIVVLPTYREASKNVFR